MYTVSFVRTMMTQVSLRMRSFICGPPIWISSECKPSAVESWNQSLFHWDKERKYNSIHYKMICSSSFFPLGICVIFTAVIKNGPFVIISYSSFLPEKLDGDQVSYRKKNNNKKKNKKKKTLSLHVLRLQEIKTTLLLKAAFASPKYFFLIIIPYSILRPSYL